MTLQVFIGKMGCGMGICAVGEAYLKNRQSILDCLKDLPEECQCCIKLNEEDRTNKES